MPSRKSRTALWTSELDTVAVGVCGERGWDPRVGLGGCCTVTSLTSPGPATVSGAAGAGFATRCRTFPAHCDGPGGAGPLVFCAMLQLAWGERVATWQGRRCLSLPRYQFARGETGFTARPGFRWTRSPAQTNKTEFRLLFIMISIGSGAGDGGGAKEEDVAVGGRGR